MNSKRKIACWEIMNCEENTKCPARLDPERNCWDLAREHGHPQSAMHVCEDCVVHYIGTSPGGMNGGRVSKLLAGRRLVSRLYPKCPMMPRESDRLERDRREFARFNLIRGGRVLMRYPVLREGLGDVHDISPAGLSFTYEDACGGTIEGEHIVFDLLQDDWKVHNLAGRIVSDFPLSESQAAARRCCLQFSDLSREQRMLLNSLVERNFRLEQCA